MTTEYLAVDNAKRKKPENEIKPVLAMIIKRKENETVEKRMKERKKKVYKKE